jgi:hypothetical protein
MAQDQKKPPVGGNKPKPATTSGGGAGQSAKDRSRAQSRPVTGKAPTGKGGKATGTNKVAAGGDRGGGGNKPRPGSRPAPTPPKRTVSGPMMAWGAVGLVVVIIVVLVIVKATGSSNSGGGAYTPVTPAPAAVVHDVTAIPASVYDTVGINSPTFAVSPPVIVKNQPSLTLNGKTPSMLYVGAEYCPFCAAERWAMTAALSRFGTWSNLKITASSHTDVAADTNTFSYYGASYTSPYINFVHKEIDSNVPDANNNPPYKTLETLTKEEGEIATKYSSSQFISGSQGGISFPFVSIDNRAIISGASYQPEALAGQSWSEIASGLRDAKNPVTQAIVASANYISASICASTKNAPASVCNSSGVQAATKALKLG